jgi:hypothetical protein
MNWREFIAVSAASPVVTSMGTLDAEVSGLGKAWYETMLRCGRVNFNEQDPLTMKADAWMDYFVSLKGNAALLNSGGIQECQSL